MSNHRPASTSSRSALPTLLSASGVAAFFAACAPQSAELKEGEYTAFLASTNSITLLKGTVDPEDYDTTFNVDCREFETREDRAALELDDPLKICNSDNWPPPYETWATQSGYYVVHEKLDPWRGQALITAEGDLQISFHHRVPGGADMRIVLAIDPDFGPVTCEADDSELGFRHTLRDGDWVAEWSKELDRIDALPDDVREGYAVLDGLAGGKLYFLNAFGYQYDPDADASAFWGLPREWQAGAAQGRYVEENLFHRSPRYGEPEVFNFVSTASATAPPNAGDDMFYCDLEPGEDPNASDCVADLEAHIDDVVLGTQADLAMLSTPAGEDEPVVKMLPIRHMNNWRPVNGLASGFDGWGELNYSYVAFSKGSQLEVGGSASGAFGVVLESTDSSSKVYMQGKFDIPKIKRDKWQTDDLEKETIKKNGTQLCEAASWDDANLPKKPPAP